MSIDAIFPAASELVMLYGGALASGALTKEVDVLGWHTSGFGAYVAVVLAGVLGYQLGADLRLVRRHPRRPRLPGAARPAPPRPACDRAERWFARWDFWAVLVGRLTPVARSFISIPAGVFETPFGRYNVLTLVGNSIWCAVLAASAGGSGRIGTVPCRLPLRRIPGGCRDRARGGVFGCAQRRLAPSRRRCDPPRCVKAQYAPLSPS